MMILSFGREEATRTPDPYVPNVVRYQLRYFSFASANDTRSLPLTSIICWRKFSRFAQKRFFTDFFSA